MFPSVLANPDAFRVARRTLVEEGMAQGGPPAAMERFLRGVAGDAAFESLDPQLRERLLGNGDVFFGLVVVAGTDNRDPAAGGHFRYEAARWLAAQLDTALVEIPDAHMPYFTQPRAFAAALHLLLDKLTRAGSVDLGADPPRSSATTVMASTMKRVSANGVELECECAGSGEAVVFIHGVGIADSFLPLAAEPALQDHYRVIRYRRRGYAGSTPIQRPVSIAEHAQDCRGLLDALEVTQAHVIGHSYGAFVALQLAIDAPGAVASLALFEPPLHIVVNPQRFLGPFRAKYLAGDRVAAVDDFFSMALGSDWRTEVSRTAPGGPEQAERDAATMFESDLLPGQWQQWHFGAEEAAKITRPVLFLYGADGNPAVITEVHDLVHSWLPQTEDDVMPNANHLLHIRHPADAAARLASFLQRHPFRLSQL